jgi:hypothetical protein
LDHFSVFQYKANDAWLVGDYAENAIRPHALGHFRDLVLATLTHPAMLQYLDNAQNAAGHVNENYAREIMELHTLGVGSGYSQQDVDTNFAGMINAFKFGAPPHGGSAPGIDRIVMLLADEPNIREVILFPMNQKAEDLMMNAPSEVDDRQLKELNIKLVPQAQ